MAESNVNRLLQSLDKHIEVVKNQLALSSHARNPTQQETIPSTTTATVEDTKSPAKTSIAPQRARLLHGPLSHEPSIALSELSLDDSSTTLDKAGQDTEPSLEYCFSPMQAVAKFPYKWIKKGESQAVAGAFFDANKIWNRTWSLYYVRTDLSSASAAVTLVPLKQFQKLLDKINQRFPTLRLKIMTKHYEGGLVVDFKYIDSKLRPTFLGQCSSREQHDRLRDGVLGLARADLINVSNRDKMVYESKVDLALSAGKNKGKGSARSQVEANIAGRSQLETAKALLLEQDVILIAIDVEANELNHRAITEVGVATLDTKDLRSILPGKNGKDWQKSIVARHFIVAEHQHMVNTDYVKGCPDKFDFGTSEVVSLQDLASVLTSCFHSPYGKTEGSTEQVQDEDKRRIVLIGHDTQQDIQYCKNLGFSILNRSSLIEVLDTAAMFRAYSASNDSRALGYIVDHFGFEPWHLHNGGNDAVYTMWILLAMCASLVANDQATRTG